MSLPCESPYLAVREPRSRIRPQGFQFGERGVEEIIALRVVRPKFTSASARTEYGHHSGRDFSAAGIATRYFVNLCVHSLSITRATMASIALMVVRPFVACSFAPSHAASLTARSTIGMRASASRYQ